MSLILDSVEREIAAGDARTAPRFDCSSPAIDRNGLQPKVSFLRIWKYSSLNFRMFYTWLPCGGEIWRIYLAGVELSEPIFSTADHVVCYGSSICHCKVSSPSPTVVICFHPRKAKIPTVRIVAELSLAFF